MSGGEIDAVRANVAEWRKKATALDTTAEILDVEDQHHETDHNRVMIDRLRAVAVAYRVCASDAEGAILPF